MQHDGSARLTFSLTSQLVQPALRNLEGALAFRQSQGLEGRHVRASLIRGAARPLVVGLRALGLDVVRRDGLELPEHMLRRGIVAGATDMTDYLETEVLEHIFKNTAIFASPTAVFIALYTADPGETGAGTEVANANGYARESVGTTGTEWTLTANAVTNLSDIDFGAASGGNWGTITHTAITDSATWGGGNHLLNGALTASKVVNDGDSFKFAAGDIDVTFD